ncbi:hypothetical protein M408DRAFT_333708 [Serendipita vermifera MAFF 305830]|uniref:Uncharacterized protein n=1 Tax=Serendipita vermifera MAFF 305830 TaxID=933852 RepID=A0A0C2W3C6_SERVB|nr:hypothetical protein M408DRAFT_333708 [Serendipita vermifera MAFF 305830]
MTSCYRGVEIRRVREKREELIAAGSRGIEEIEREISDDGVVEAQSARMGMRREGIIRTVQIPIFQLNGDGNIIDNDIENQFAELNRRPGRPVESAQSKGCVSAMSEADAYGGRTIEERREKGEIMK